MYKFALFNSLLEPRLAWPQRKSRGARALLVAAACACVAGCDIEPSVLFVANEGPAHFLQLTDAQEECAAPGRVCFSMQWDVSTRGCWVRDQSNVRASFPNDEQVVPVDSFKRTGFAELRHVSLE
jgi:hypothetical protein